MSMTTNPTADALSSAAFLQAHKDETMTSLGSAFNASRSRRFDFLGCPGAHSVNADATIGTGVPTVENVKMAEWGHRGHSLTHLGTMISSRGSMYAWYCQDDNVSCYDTKS